MTINPLFLLTPEARPSLLSQLLSTPTKRKIFVSYQHSNDQWYYDEFSKKFHDDFGIIHDASLDRVIDSTDCEYVMRKIREEYLTGTSCTIVLLGPQSRGRKYIDWEIKATLDKKHALIGLWLPTNEPTYTGLSKPNRFQDNLDSGFAVIDSWQAVMNNTSYLPVLIEQARARSTGLIDNSRPLMTRNNNRIDVTTSAWEDKKELELQMFLWRQNYGLL